MHAAVQKSRRDVVIDALDFASVLKPSAGWQTEWIQLRPGPVSHTAVRVAFGSVSYIALQTSSAGILRGSTAPGSCTLFMGMPSATPVRTCARPVGSDTRMMLGPAAPFDLYLPESGGVMIFASAIANVEHQRFSTLDSRQAAQVAEFLESVEQMRSIPSTSQDTSDSPRRLREHLRSTSAALFRNISPAAQPRRERLQRHAAVIRACEFIDGHLRDPIALADLCAASGVGTRALEYGFHDFYDLGPMAYVRNLRLCRVRLDLLNAANKGQSVSGTARSWSFTHMGQFSHDYRVLFGEMPSITLTRRPSPDRQRATTAAGALS
jgi:AraC family ethanolamine operon transcriptional activator